MQQLALCADVLCDIHIHKSSAFAISTNNFKQHWLCLIAVTCTPEQDDRRFSPVSLNKPLTALQIALEHGHATTAALILKAAVQAGADVSSAALESVDMLHRSASKYVIICACMSVVWGSKDHRRTHVCLRCMSTECRR